MRRALLPLILLTGCASVPPPPRPAADSACSPTQIARARPTLQPLRRVPPIYPREAADRGVEGWVCLAFSIDAEGMIADARVVEAFPRGLFDASALESLRRWQYVRYEAIPETVRDRKIVLTYALPRGT